MLHLDFPVHVVRHGETLWNREDRLQGHLDSALSPEGQMQGFRLRPIVARVTQQAPAFDFYSSPLGRTMATARMILPARRPTMDRRLIEIHLGDWQGKTLAEVDRTRSVPISESDPFMWKFEAPGGESYDALRGRVRDFLRGLKQTSLLVTHGVTGQVIRGVLLGLDAETTGRLPFDQGVVYTVYRGKHFTDG